jgi:7-carboxy-7-deazaguanine synthase
MSATPDPTAAPTGAVEPVLRVVERFGPTVQGEGASVGRAAFFLRLAGCNLTCVWCDTPFSWDPTRPDAERPETELAVEEVLEHFTAPSAISGTRVRHLVITGGEPLLQREALAPLCTRLHDRGWTIEVETSGTISPGRLTELIDQFNVSPKLAHSGVDERARIRLGVLNEFAANPRALFKFVVQQANDLLEAAALLDRLDRPVEPCRVFVMAEGIDAQVVLERSRALIDDVVARGWGLTPRWHTLLWGDERGR